MSTTTKDGRSPADRVSQRLRPLQLAMFVSGIAPWVPVEKVFMTELGFTPGLVATMAAAYAAVVPLLEIPSGILADRWSRRGVLMLANASALLSVLVGGLSTGVGTYIVSAMILGVFFALQSGTVDSIVYDTLLEEVGNADQYEKRFGRIQTYNSVALTASALVGGVLAGLTSARMTYLITMPFAAAGLVLLFRFREPVLHRKAASTGIREHLSATRSVILSQPRIAVIVVVSVLTGATVQMLFEFGPLWLLAVGVPTALFGPYTAGMTATFGLGGLLAGHLRLDRAGQAASATAIIGSCGLALALGTNGVLVIAAQVVLIATLITISIHVSRLLHDATPSSMRTGVSSGVSTLTWLTFLPSALLFGVISRHGGVHTAGWIVLAMVTGAGCALTAISCPRPARRGAVSPCPDALGIAPAAG